MMNLYDKCEKCLEAWLRYAEGLEDEEPTKCEHCPFEGTDNE